MKEIKYDNFAIIFQIKNYYNGKIVLIPTDAKVGTYDAENNKFIDDSGLCYSHIIEISDGYGFFGCSDLESRIKDYKKIPLKLARKIILSNYKKATYDYVNELNTGAPLILVKRKYQQVCPLIDEYMYLYYANNYEEFFNSYINDDTETLSNDSKLPRKDSSHDRDIHSSKEEEKNTSNNYTIDAKKLYNEMLKRVVGQDEQIKTIIIALWKHYSNFSDEKSRNILINGHTGTGKTEIFRSLSKLIDVPCITVDASRYSATGYIGKNIEDMLIQLLIKADGDINKAQHGILIIDEVDKISSKDNRSDVNTTDVQVGLLKLLEDGIFSINFNNQWIEFDTSNLLVIAGGSWSHISSAQKNTIGFNTSSKEDKNTKFTKKDFEENGMMPEFLGRFPIAIQLNDLSLNDYIAILTNPCGILSKNINFFKSQNIELIFTEEAIYEIANASFKSIFGARSLDEIIENILVKASFEIASNPSGTYEKLIISKDSVFDNSKYCLIKADNSSKVKTKKREVTNFIK